MPVRSRAATPVAALTTASAAPAPTGDTALAYVPQVVRDVEPAVREGEQTTVSLILAEAG